MSNSSRLHNNTETNDDKLTKLVQQRDLERQQKLQQETNYYQNFQKSDQYLQDSEETIKHSKKRQMADTDCLTPQHENKSNYIENTNTQPETAQRNNIYKHPTSYEQSNQTDRRNETPLGDGAKKQDQMIGQQQKDNSGVFSDYNQEDGNTRRAKAFHVKDMDSNQSIAHLKKSQSEYQPKSIRTSLEQRASTNVVISDANVTNKNQHSGDQSPFQLDTSQIGFYEKKKTKYFVEAKIPEIETQESQQDKQQPKQEQQPQLNQSKDQEVKEQKVGKVKGSLIFMFQLVLQYGIFLGLSIFVIPYLGIKEIFNLLLAGKYFDTLKTFSILFSFMCSIYTLMTIFFFAGDQPSIILFQCDCVFFLLTSYIVYSYLSIVIDQNLVEVGINSSFDYKIQKMINLLLQKDFKQQFYRFDILSQELLTPEQLQVVQKENNSGIQTHQQLNRTQLINYFQNKDQKIGDVEEVKPNTWQLVLITIAILCKIVFVFWYMQVQPEELTIKDWMSMSILVFTYFQTGYNLNTILGNYDLIRRKRFMKKLRNEISESNDSFKKLITSPLKLEIWDDTRKSLLNYKNEFLEDLEVTYFCFIFYYIFVILVCASAFFELYWIFQSDSFFLEPINVIMNTLNFVYISLLLLFRIYQGTEFNGSFSSIKFQIAVISDAVSDLITIQPEENEINKYTDNKFKLNIYQNIIDEVKIQSEEYTKVGGKEYLNKKYSKENEQQLIRKMYLNLERCYAKISSSIQIDAEKYDYKFCNMFTIDFKEFALTVVIALITTLPSIIPKFKEYLVES